jgi:hypothetical protein
MTGAVRMGAVTFLMGKIDLEKNAAITLFSD